MESQANANEKGVIPLGCQGVQASQGGGETLPPDTCRAGFPTNGRAPASFAARGLAVSSGVRSGGWRLQWGAVRGLTVSSRVRSGGWPSPVGCGQRAGRLQWGAVRGLTVSSRGALVFGFPWSRPALWPSPASLLPFIRVRRTGGTASSTCRASSAGNSIPKRRRAQRMPGAPVFRVCGWGYLSLAPRVMESITASRLKLPGFWLGGNSLKLCSHSPT